jgi:SP family sugar:H+ symporter-like MFS transporter
MNRQSNSVKAMEVWKCTFANNGPCAITSGRESLTVSILSAGTFVGALLGAPIGDRFGRKWGVIIGVFIFTIGVIVQLATEVFGAFIAGRVLAGLGVGVISTLIPAYQSEWSVHKLHI